MKYGRITFNDLILVRRTILSVVVCQLLGGVIGLALGLHYSWFMNFWLGGAAATFPGFVIGLVWQLKSSEGHREWIGVAFFLGSIAIVLTGVDVGFVVPSALAEMRRLEVLPQLQDQAFYRIDVFDRYGRENTMSLTNANSIGAFTRGIADAVGHSPNHPLYSRSWYVVLEGTTHHEFELHLNPEFPQSVIGDFVVKSGNHTSCYGTFKSKGLRPWVEKYLTSRDAKERVKAIR